MLKSGISVTLLIFLLLISACQTDPPSSLVGGKRVAGYFSSSNIYKRNYQVSDIPVTQLTHIFYAFMKIDPDNTLAFYDKNADIVRRYGNEPADLGYRGSFAQLYLLKQKYPALRIIASVGGGTQSTNFSTMAGSAAGRATFTTSVVAFLRKYHFDGIDLDWEFPVKGGAPDVIHSPDDKTNLTLLLRSLREALNRAGREDRVVYELGLAVSPNPAYAQNLELREIGRVVDFVNIMAYDFHGGWEKSTNHLAPLLTSPEDPAYRWPAGRKLNVTGAVNYYRESGIPTTKLNLGIPLYGFGWQIKPESKKPLYTATVPKANLPDTGVIDYSEIQGLIAQGAQSSWDEYAHAPYLYNPTTGLFVSYDNERSVSEKLKLIKDNNLGGVMFWELSQDRKGELISQTRQALRRLLGL